MNGWIPQGAQEHINGLLVGVMVLAQLEGRMRTRLLVRGAEARIVELDLGESVELEGVTLRFAEVSEADGSPRRALMEVEP